MSTLSLARCTHAVNRSDFERDQQWPDTPQNRRLLATYGAACVGFRNKCEILEIAATTKTTKNPHTRACGRI